MCFHLWFEYPLHSRASLCKLVLTVAIKDLYKLTGFFLIWYPRLVYLWVFPSHLLCLAEQLVSATALSLLLIIETDLDMMQ